MHWNTPGRSSAKLRNTWGHVQLDRQGDSFWYPQILSQIAGLSYGVDAATGKQSPLFDAEACPRVGKVGSKNTAASTIRGLRVASDGHIRRRADEEERRRLPVAGVASEVNESSYQCDLPVSACKLLPEGKVDEIMSPDRHYAAFVRDHNLFVRGRRQRCGTPVDQGRR